MGLKETMPGCGNMGIEEREREEYICICGCAWARGTWWAEPWGDVVLVRGEGDEEGDGVDEGIEEDIIIGGDGDGVCWAVLIPEFFEACSEKEAGEVPPCVLDGFHCRINGGLATSI